MSSDFALPSDRPHSALDWETELEVALSGGRDSDLRYIGTLDEYVRVGIANSIDPATSRINFRQSLERSIEFWHPDPVGEQRRTLHMLDLIRAWTPSRGFDKVMEMMSRWGAQALDCRLPFSKRTIDLRQRGFSALERYFPVSPLKENAAFAAYVELLETYLERDHYRVYAAQRLTVLGIVDLANDSVIQLLDKHPLAISAFIELALQNETHEEATTALTSLYAKCKAHGRLIELKNGVKALGGQAEVFEDRVVEIHLRGERYQLNQSTGEIVRNWDEVPKHLWKEIDRVTKRQREDVPIGLNTASE